MNPIFNKYISTTGKRYSDCSNIESSEYTYTTTNTSKHFIVTSFIHHGEPILFFECKNSGFISKKHKSITKNILHAHFEIVNIFGTISDLIGFSGLFFENMSDIFILDNENELLKNIIDDYKIKKSDKKTQNSNIIIENLIPFACETNGNIFLYDASGKIYFYGFDHLYKNINCVPGYPEYSLYTIEAIPTFDIFVTQFFNNCN